jgi:Skp family chaperone for outer membrane proteins
MNRKNLMLALVVGFIAAAPGFAQGPATQTRPQSPATQTRPQTPVTNVPVSKVAVVFSVEFQNPKTGIARFVMLLTKLNAEFQKIQDELNQMAQRINQISDDLNKTRNIADPKVTQQKIDQLDQLKKDYQRRTEDAQSAYQRRRLEVLGPLQDDVGKALDTYAKAHAITIVIDGSQVQGIVYASESIDITKAFISDYNIKNPATASVTTPK